ncbi:MAG: hypothetical protein LC624_06425 [Halobacteriales archaeon]|nr:hypothetical protein [Halobacteriales archaeon]
MPAMRGAGTRGRRPMRGARLFALALVLSVLAGCAAPAPPPAGAGGVRVLASFDRAPPGPLGSWDARGGTWSVEANGSAPSPPNLVLGQPPAGEPGVLLVPGQSYADVDVSVNVSGPGGVAFRFSNGSYVGVVYDPATHTLTVGHRAPGSSVLDGRIDWPVSGAWVTVSAHVRGTRATIFLGAAQALVADVPAGEGQAGMLVAAQGAARFDDLVVEPQG